MTAFISEELLNAYLMRSYQLMSCDPLCYYWFLVIGRLFYILDDQRRGYGLYSVHSFLANVTLHF